MVLARFSVHGQAVPQGSLVAHVKGNKASIHYASGSGLAVWRNKVSAAARDAWTGDVYGGPIRIELTFRRQRPRSHYRNLGYELRAVARDEQPVTAPDLDKLIRAILDSLSGIIYHDDAQVVSIAATKVYAQEPGVDIVIA